ncbi:hypothetical protein FB472_2768 [Rhodoglobus vestalii]|uniref:Uncharacterized protein n=1 Tax=Rhodoglobus vestalii TaxID=193384 RepID=A0A8H2PZW8_9MICO|nr:hypothetical protein FB472_2768 [Rhodoglobus vestalii]
MHKPTGNVTSAVELWQLRSNCATPAPCKLVCTGFGGAMAIAKQLRDPSAVQTCLHGFRWSYGNCEAIARPQRRANLFARVSVELWQLRSDCATPAPCKLVCTGFYGSPCAVKNAFGKLLTPAHSPQNLNFSGVRARLSVSWENWVDVSSRLLHS